ncbi:hypothetical protein BN946_scf184608.g4 [Trametes cinnabarina]|uniref:C3H1-type domain-containing protein n=1 Tax=Pycnoporus cinnabarinus TaxID=5643 RepID=A0A060T137_PYCCI|nr:hypothetical protein BN946_scf184608.g4 [Trametes cinnabarina]
MAFGLIIGTDRATALQNAIQDELIKRGFSPDADPVMAEYITIMIINNKTPAQISSELEDLIGPEFGAYTVAIAWRVSDNWVDASFVDWLFAEAAKGAPESEAPVPAEPSTSKQTLPHEVVIPPATDSQRRPPSGPRAGAPLYQQAISQAIPSTSPSAQKRTSSARSPSPSGPPAKSRRTDLPTGPRAMFRDGHGGHRDGGRSLLERVGPARSGHGPPFPHDEVQARIDSITNGSPDPNMMMMNGGFPMNGMPGMDMAAMGMANPLMLQELMMNQMAMMSQIAGAMGILPPQGPFMNGPFPGQPGMGGDMGAFGGGPVGASPGGPDGRGRGRGRGGTARGGGRGRGGHVGHHANEQTASNGVGTAQSAVATPAPVAAPAPVIAAPAPLAASTSTGPTRSGFVPPERPQSPTLCKFGLKCTNPICRYSHPSPVATPESGVVLSNDPCEKGKDCKDKDCIKGHVSPAALNPNAEVPKPSTFVAPAPAVQQNTVPCRYGAACTRPNCTFSHPTRQAANHAQACRFGAACTRATCPFQHPESRVLPSTFHRGLQTTGGMVKVSTPEAGSMGAPSPHKSVSFNKKPDGANGAASGDGRRRLSASASAADLEKKVKEMEERKNEAQKAIAAAQAGKKDDASKSVPISA